MGMLRRIVDAIDPVETRSMVGADHLMPAMLAGTRPVNARLAENLSMVLAPVSAIATALSSLPVWVYRRTPAGRVADENHPIMRLVREGPNPHQSWPDFMEFIVASILLRGNGVSEIVADNGTGEIRELRAFPWSDVAIQLLGNGRLAYDVSDTNGLYYGAIGRTRRLLQDQVLHIRDRSDDGLIGRSRLSRCASVVSVALAVQEFSASLYENGINPSGALEVEGKLSPEALKQLAKNFREAFTGSHNAARTLVLDQAVKWKQISISPEDAEMLATRRFSGEELARLYQVPPPIVGDLTHGTFTNSETLIRFFAQSTLSSWCRKIEAAFMRSLLSESDRQTHEIEIDLSGLLRGDPETRWASHKIAVDARILTPNEIREEEGWNPRPGGDEFPAAAAGATS